jgi:hypothetical protein
VRAFQWKNSLESGMLGERYNYGNSFCFFISKIVFQLLKKKLTRIHAVGIFNESMRVRATRLASFQIGRKRLI